MKNTAIPIDVPFIDITNLEEKKKKRICVWGLDIMHNGTVDIELLFACIEVPICESHLTHHKAILALVYKANIDIKIIIDWSKDKCLKEVALRGIIPTEQ